MTDAFAGLVSPVFYHVIQLLQRMEQGESPALEPERNRLIALIGEADQQAATSGALAHDFALARHALIYWVDEILINSPWRNALEWKNRILEWDYFQERIRADKFF